MTRPKVLIYRPVDESGDSHRRIEAAGLVGRIGQHGPGATPHEVGSISMARGAVHAIGDATGVGYIEGAMAGALAAVKAIAGT